MSNEELVAAIQAGAIERMGELWEQMERLVKWKAHRIMMATDGLPGRGVEFEDLYHSGYLALVEAVKTYDPTTGAFSTWFMWYLKTAFAVAGGYRTRKGQNEPLNNAVSLDTPLSDDSDSDTMLEVVADPKGQNPMQDIEEAIFQQQLQETMKELLATMPEQYGEVLRLRYYEGQTYAEVAEVQGITPEQARQTESKGIRRLRQPKNAARLRPFHEFNSYSGTGLGAFRATGMSVQERYLVHEEDREERRKRQGVQC